VPEPSHLAGAGSPHPRAQALRLIIAYKLARGGASLLACALLAAFTAAGRTAPLHAVAEQVRRHATSAWSIELSDVLVRAVVPRHLWLVVGALALDGTFTVLEGWTLHRSWWWGPWLVVVSTAAFLPYEAVALGRNVDAGRVLLLALNLGVALYLARRALRERRSSGLTSSSTT
jgi:uncharacterized membrane protein (DUF2068 family)